MTFRSLALNVLRAILVVSALAVMFLTPVMTVGPSGRSYELEGIAIDLVALIVLALVVISVRRGRARKPV